MDLFFFKIKLFSIGLGMAFGYSPHIVQCLTGIMYDSFSLSLLFILFLPLQSSKVISLNVRFWDLSQLRYRTLQLQCHYIGDIDTQSTVPPVIIKPLHQIIPHLTKPTTARPPPEFQVLCSSQHMSIKLPSGPTSGLFVQGEFEVQAFNIKSKKIT